MVGESGVLAWLCAKVTASWRLAASASPTILRNAPGLPVSMSWSPASLHLIATTRRLFYLGG